MIAKLFPDIVSGVWAINKEAAEGYLPFIVSILKGQTPTGEDYSEARQRSRSISYATFTGSAFNLTRRTEDEDIPDNSIAIISIKDPVTKYDMYCGPEGMLSKIERMQMADADERIKAVMLDIDTPGGEGYAALAMVTAIKAMNTPVISFINDFATSAGYMIASVSDEIFANSELAITGSIGTYIQVADFRKQLEMEGINLHTIYAKDSTDKNRDYKEAINYNYELVQARANRFNDEFLSTVKTGRSDRLKSDQEDWGTGRTFYAGEALEMGLIDGIKGFEDTLQHIFDNLINS